MERVSCADDTRIRRRCGVLTDDVAAVQAFGTDGRDQVDGLRRAVLSANISTGQLSGTVEACVE